MDRWAWLIWTGVSVAAAMATLSGAVLLAVACSGRRRCPRLAATDAPHGRCDCCGYRLEGLEDGLCPECGWAYADNRRLPPVRRFQAAAAGLALMALAFGLLVAPQVAQRGWMSLLPDSALIVILPLAPGGEPGPGGAGCGANIERGSAVHRALQGRLDQHGLSPEQRTDLARRCADIIANARDERARAAAARLLFEVAAHGADAAAELMSALDDPSPLIRARVLSALGTIASQGPCEGVRASIAQRLLGAAVCDPDETARRQAVEALGRLRAPPGLAGILARAVRDPSPVVRARALYSLGSAPMGGPDDERILAAAAAGALDAQVSVREAAIYALSNLAESHGGAVLLLSLSLRDDSREIRQQAASALERLGRKAAPVSTSLLSGAYHDNPDLQSAMFNALNTEAGL